MKNQENSPMKSDTKCGGCGCTCENHGHNPNRKDNKPNPKSATNNQWC